MAVAEKAATSTPAAPTQSDIDWLNKRIDNINIRIDKLSDKMKLLIRVLVDKKIIGDELAKSFTETRDSTDELVKWYIDKKRKKD